MVSSIMEKTKKNYKYCIVPECKSTTVTTPDKIFFSVPKQGKIRRQWCKVMRRCPKKNKVLSNSTALFCCEDHFNLQEDMENFWQHKLLQNVERYKLKKGVLPHIFKCQREDSISSEKNSIKKRLSDLNEKGYDHTLSKEASIAGSSKGSLLYMEHLGNAPFIKIEVKDEPTEEDTLIEKELFFKQKCD